MPHSSLKVNSRFDPLVFPLSCLSARTATKLLKEHKNDARLGILAWSFGKLGHWSLLVDLSEEVEEIEKRQQQERYQRMGFSSETIRLLTVGDVKGA